MRDRFYRCLVRVSVCVCTLITNPQQDLYNFFYVHDVGGSAGIFSGQARGRQVRDHT